MYMYIFIYIYIYINIQYAIIVTVRYSYPLVLWGIMASGPQQHNTIYACIVI